MGQTCEQHHVQPEPDNKTTRAPQPCPGCPQLLRATDGGRWWRWEGRAALRKSTYFATREGRGSGQQGWDGKANSCITQHSSWECRQPGSRVWPRAPLSCESGSSGDNQAWLGGAGGCLHLGLRCGNRGCCGRAAPFAAPVHPSHRSPGSGPLSTPGPQQVWFIESLHKAQARFTRESPSKEAT